MFRGVATPPSSTPLEPRADFGDLHSEISLALHDEVARTLSAEIVATATRNTESWLATAGSATPLLLEWREILARPLEDIRVLLCERTEHAAWLRKASPFAGAIPPRERERIVREVRRRLGRSAPGRVA